MSYLRKMQSANLPTKEPRDIEDSSPDSKSDSGHQGGGVRLDVDLSDLHLDSPPPAPRFERTNGHIGRSASLSLTDSDDEYDESDGPFQVGKTHDDGDVFDSPVRARPQGQDSVTMAPMAHPAPSDGPASHLLPLAMDVTVQATDIQALQSPLSVNPALQGQHAGQLVALDSSMQGAMQNAQPVPMLRSRRSDLSSRAQIGGVDAQSFYPATACVFVANLPDSVRDSRLEAELTRVFSRYGVVFVKIRRDNRNMPFAFCQYTNDDDARTAMKQARGSLIEGRPCRTEMVKANRSFVMYDIHNRDVDLEEVRQHLSTYGPIVKMERLSQNAQEAMDAEGGILVEFASFDPGRDVIAAFRYHPVYRVVAYDLKKSSQRKVDLDELWLQRYEMDRRSIFVGNLPTEVPNLEEELSALVEKVGSVEKVQVLRKEGRGTRAMSIAFGFVEFSRPDTADNAVRLLAGTVLHGTMLRVERKASREPAAPNPRYRQNEVVFPSAPSSVAESSRTEKAVKATKATNDTNDTKATKATKAVDDSSSPSVNGKITNGKAVEHLEPTTPSRAPPTPQAKRPSSQRSNGTNGSAPGSGVSQGSASASSSVSRLSRSASQHFMPYMGSHFSSPNYGAHFPMNAQNVGGTYPTTPQGTPGMHMGPMTPYYGTPYASTPYTWMTPYIQDPGLSAMAYYDPYASAQAATSGGPSMPGGPGMQVMSGAADNEEDGLGEEATTPTKSGRRGAGKGRGH
ncbi:hypothetical protein M426DRAFT_8696 [Hypoxylon sp. CI-4A]|nr:hypothetical protein M426DRAFT_8696 [Hypoxylon sp. CI-4A]